jgi:nucleotide-binding universal stress UspA family protein
MLAEAARKIVEKDAKGRGYSGLHSEALVAPDLATVAETLVELVRKYDSHRRVETHGPRALREVILGNTTQELLKTAPCPVVAAGTQAD